MYRWRYEPAAALLIVTMGLAGCTTPRSGAGEAAALASCDVLTADEVAEVAGHSLPDPRGMMIAGLPTRQWGQPDERVQTVSVAADTWAKQVPAVVEQMERSGQFDDPENRRKLERARPLINSAADIAPGKACDLFTSMVEIQGQKPDMDLVVTLLPSKDSPKAISGQTCTKGVYTSVMLVTGGLSGSDEEVARVEDAARIAHGRGIKS